MSHHERVRLLTFSSDDRPRAWEGMIMARPVLSQPLREECLQQCHREASTSGRLWPLGEVGEVLERSALLATCRCIVATCSWYMLPSMWPIRCWTSDGTGYMRRVPIAKH